jgi:hypothetical protein
MWTLASPQGPHADARLRGDARGRDHLSSRLRGRLLALAAQGCGQNDGGLEVWSALIARVKLQSPLPNFIYSTCCSPSRPAIGLQPGNEDVAYETLKQPEFLVALGQLLEFFAYVIGQSAHRDDAALGFSPPS